MYHRFMAGNLIAGVRSRLAHAQQDLGGALAVMRSAASQPNYTGPKPDKIEQIAAALAEVRATIRDWAIDEALSRPPRPRARPQAVRKLIAELASRD
jgi:hypothetical protein